MLLTHCRSYIFILNLASIISIASAENLSVGPTLRQTAPSEAITSSSNTDFSAKLSNGGALPTDGTNSQMNYKPTLFPTQAPLLEPPPVAPVTFPQSAITQPFAAPFSLAPIVLAPIPPTFPQSAITQPFAAPFAAPFALAPAAPVTFQPQSTIQPLALAQIPLPPAASVTFQPKTTTIQPLAAVYELAVMQQVVNAKRDEDALQFELRIAQEEINYKYRREYESVVKEKIEISKEKERVLIQLQAQLKLQLEAQQFATSQRAHAIKEMQDKLAKELLKEKADAEALKLKVQSIVDLSPLILNVTQHAPDKENSTSFDFSNLENAQNGASGCAHEKNKSNCNKLSNHCAWGRLEKNKKNRCLFMCASLSKDHCSKVSGCYFDNDKCKNK